MRANGTFVLSEEWTDADTAIGRVSEGLDKASKGCGNGFSGEGAPIGAQLPTTNAEVRQRTHPRPLSTDWAPEPGLATASGAKRTFGR